MKYKNMLILLGLGAVLLNGCGTSNGAKPKGSWKCSAKSLQNYSYNGGSFANIHLRGYSYGGDYKVTLNKNHTIATGTTSDGTPFKCIRN